jgi:uncharacterized cupredoxin-like copper-binding protein
VHTALQLALVLAAGKSKLPFYLAGGLLVAWALLVSMAIGMRRPDFPKTEAQQRAVMAITAILVLLAVSMAVVTSGGESKAAAQGTRSQPAAEVTPQPATTSSSSQSTSAPAGASPQPKATTGTPAPPSSPAAGKPTKLALAADAAAQLAFDKKTLSAKAGTVEIDFSNPSPIEHDVTVAQGSTVLGHTPTFVGGSKTLTLSLKPGTYTFYCSVPGHRQAGMEGTLTVSA